MTKISKTVAIFLIFLMFLSQVIAAGIQEADDNGIVKSFTKLDDIIAETVWCGDENQVVLILTESNSVYRSDDRGENFKKITKKMLKTAEKVVENAAEIGEVTNMIKSEADTKTIVFVGNKGVFWASSDCGATMKALNKEFLIAQLKMHPTEPNWMLATSMQDCKGEDEDLCFFGTHELYITRNLGETWKLVANNVKQFDWSFNPEQVYMGLPPGRIYALIRTKSQDVLYRTDDYKNMTTLVNNCLEFRLRATYMFAIQKGTTGDEVFLLVSTIQDKFAKFYKSIFPDIKLKMKNVHILDSSEGVVFILATRKATNPYGRLYISDSTGLRYRLALKRVMRDPERGADFAKIAGLEGIYMANVVEHSAATEYERMSNNDDTEEEEWDDEERKEGITGWISSKPKKKNPLSMLSSNVRTFITFNKGAAWKYLTAPKADIKNSQIVCKGDKECSLNIFLYHDTTTPVYSQLFAHGLIIATGNVGRTRLSEVYARNVYLSRDGGLTWMEIAKGSHVYDMADHGGLLIMSRLQANNRHKASVLYSWNEGSSWDKLYLTTYNATIEDIFTEPDSISQHFLVHVAQVSNATEGAEERHSSIYSLNFQQLHQRACAGDDKPGEAGSDFELWSPYDGRHGQNCLLGRKISYIRRKRDSECYNGVRFESYMDVNNCECTEEDYECDFGFIRKDLIANSPCIAAINVSYAPPAVCPSGTTYNVTNGYRRVTGDTCEGGVSHDPIVIPCPSTSLMSGSGLIILVLLFVIVVLLLGIGYTYQNFEDIRTRLQSAFKSSKKGKSKDYPFKDVKYGKIEEKQQDEDEEVIIQPSSVTTETKKTEKKDVELE